MGIFKRLRDISLSSLHELLNRAEDPVLLMNQYIRDMEAELSEAEVAFAKQIAAEKRLQHQVEEAAELVLQREQGAIAALKNGDEALARRALVDKKEQQSRAEAYQKQHESAKTISDSLRGQLQEMKAELEQMKRTRDELTARAAAAKTQKRMNDTMAAIGKGSSVSDFQRMKEKVVQLEAEAEASHVLKNESRSLDRELNALGEKSAIDAELEKLKQQLNDNS